MSDLRTARLDLISATPEMLRAELVSREALAAAVSADVPATWPPELYDSAAVEWVLRWLETNPNDRRWGFFYIALRSQSGTPPARTLVGACGFKGAPAEDGTVELGYAVLPEFRRRGFALEAVRGLLASAFTDPHVAAVVGHTLPDLTPSIGVLTRAGFEPAGKGNDPTEPDAIRFLLTRERYIWLVASGP